MLGRRLIVVLAATTLSLFAQHGVCAQSNNRVLQGFFTIETDGTAEIAGATSGTCMASGTVPAALFTGIWIFDGNGHLADRAAPGTMGISIGNTFCSPQSYSATGTYTVDEVGENIFMASGMFSTRFVGNPKPLCSGLTSLQNVPFSIVGTLAAGLADTFKITTLGGGSGSSYVEGNGATPTCSAAILNFITRGTSNIVASLPLVRQ